MEAGHARAPERAHRLADGFHHAANLAVLAFAQGDQGPGADALFRLDIRGRRHDLCGGGAEMFALVVDAANEALDVRLRKGGIEADEVLLLDLVPRVGKEVGEVAIIRENEQAFAVHIEAADRVQDDVANRHHVHHGWSATVIAGRGDDADGLIEREVAVLAAVDRHAVDEDFVFIDVRAGAEFSDRLAIYSDAAIEEPILGLAARCDSCVRKDLLEPFNGHYVHFSVVTCRGGCCRPRFPRRRTLP